MVACGDSGGRRAPARPRLRPTAPRGRRELRGPAWLHAGLAHDVQLPGSPVLSKARVRGFRRSGGLSGRAPTPFLSEAPRRHALNPPRARASLAPYPRLPLPALLEASAHRVPGKAALVGSSGAVYTYEQLWGAARRLARFLQQDAGVRHGE